MPLTEDDSGVVLACNTDFETTNQVIIVILFVGKK
jgi:hypothetical protein